MTKTAININTITKDYKDLSIHNKERLINAYLNGEGRVSISIEGEDICSGGYFGQSATQEIKEHFKMRNTSEYEFIKFLEKNNFEVELRLDRVDFRSIYDLDEAIHDLIKYNIIEYVHIDFYGDMRYYKSNEGDGLYDEYIKIDLLSVYKHFTGNYGMRNIVSQYEKIAERKRELVFASRVVSKDNTVNETEVVKRKSKYDYYKNGENTHEYPIDKQYKLK